MGWVLNPIYLTLPFHIGAIMNVGITMELVNRLNSFRHYYIFPIFRTQSKMVYRNAKVLWMRQCAKRDVILFLYFLLLFIINFFPLPTHIIIIASYFYCQKFA